MKGKLWIPDPKEQEIKAFIAKYAPKVPNPELMKKSQVEICIKFNNICKDE